jgi:hypothetical protein
VHILLSLEVHYARLRFLRWRLGEQITVETEDGKPIMRKSQEEEKDLKCFTAK